MLQVQTDPFQDSSNYALSEVSPQQGSINTQPEVSPQQGSINTQPEVSPQQGSINTQPEVSPQQGSINTQPEVSPQQGSINTPPEVSNPQTPRKQGGAGSKLCLASKAGTKKFEVSNPSHSGWGYGGVEG